MHVSAVMGLFFCGLQVILDPSAYASNNLNAEELWSREWITSLYFWRNL